MNESDTSICIAVKWMPYYGIDMLHERNQLLINYLKCKYFIIHLSEKDNDENDGGFEPNDIIDDYQYYIDIWNLNRNTTKIMVGKPYTFNERLFCNINYPFNNFIRKCKKHYSNKIKSYKNPRNIMKRQLKGRY